jgi:hypothetical protein
LIPRKTRKPVTEPLSESCASLQVQHRLTGSLP